MFTLLLFYDERINVYCPQCMMLYWHA